MDELSTLAALLDITNDAWDLASEREKSERLKQLLVELRSKAKEERRQMRRGRVGSRYDLCMIGILEELNFLDRMPWKNVLGLETRLTRIRGEIERTILEIKDRRKIM